MCKRKSVKENEMHEIHLDFEIQTDHFTSARRQEKVLINKKTQKNNNKKD